jgi:hypothetical protein
MVQARPTDRLPGLTSKGTDADLIEAWVGRCGRRTDLLDLLDDLDRRAQPLRLVSTRTVQAFGWDRGDAHTHAWTPQGITTSAEAEVSGESHGREVVAVSWYLRTRAGPDRGVRVTFIDVTRRDRPRYRHVLLVAPAHEAGRLATRPVPVHAGGLVWYEGLLYVASTYHGLRVFDVADLTRVDPARHDGHAYVLPQRWAYEPVDHPAGRMRYSFVSLDRTSTPHSLVVGEYGRGVPTQVVRFDLDPTDHRPRAEGGQVEPSHAFGLDLPSMQGIASVDGRYFVTASHGRHRRGDLWVGDPEHGFRRHARALPVGPEDLAYAPSDGWLWTLSEWPGRRAVLALRAADWPGPVC